LTNGAAFLITTFDFLLAAINILGFFFSLTGGSIGVRAYISDRIYVDGFYLLIFLVLLLGSSVIDVNILDLCEGYIC
jgi:hypothetical protein